MEGSTIIDALNWAKFWIRLCYLKSTLLFVAVQGVGIDRECIHMLGIDRECIHMYVGTGKVLMGTTWYYYTWKVAIWDEIMNKDNMQTKEQPKYLGGVSQQVCAITDIEINQNHPKLGPTWIYK